MFVQPLQLPIPVKKVEIRFFLCASANAAQDIFGLPIETVKLVIHGRATVFGFYKLFTENKFLLKIILWLGSDEMEFYLFKTVQIPFGSRNVQLGFVGADDIASAAEVPFQHKLFGQFAPINLIRMMIGLD